MPGPDPVVHFAAEVADGGGWGVDEPHVAQGEDGEEHVPEAAVHLGGAVGVGLPFPLGVLFDGPKRGLDCTGPFLRSQSGLHRGFHLCGHIGHGHNHFGRVGRSQLLLPVTRRTRP